MSKLKRTTVYFEPKLHRALRLQAAETSRSVSELVNAAVRDELAQDAADLEAFDKRANEKPAAFEDFLKKLKRDRII